MTTPSSRISRPGVAPATVALYQSKLPEAFEKDGRRSTGGAGRSPGRAACGEPDARGAAPRAHDVGTGSAGAHRSDGNATVDPASASLFLLVLLPDFVRAGGPRCGRAV